MGGREREKLWKRGKGLKERGLEEPREEGGEEVNVRGRREGGEGKRG